MFPNIKEIQKTFDLDPPYTRKKEPKEPIRLKNPSRPYPDSKSSDDYTQRNQNQEEVIDLFTTMVVSDIMELDPSLEDGFQVAFEMDVPVEIRFQESDDDEIELGTRDNMHFKVLCLFQEEVGEREPKKLRVECTMETDIFFHYVHEVDEEAYEKMQEDQRLWANFDQYHGVWKEMLENCVKEPKGNQIAFVRQPESGKLEYVQLLPFTALTAMTCNFKKSDEGTIQDHATFRYNVAKSKMALYEQKLIHFNRWFQDSYHIIKGPLTQPSRNVSSAKRDKYLNLYKELKNDLLGKKP